MEANEVFDYDNRLIIMSPFDTLALATGTRVGASDHAITCFCIEYGRVLGFVL